MFLGPPPGCLRGATGATPEERQANALADRPSVGHFSCLLEGERPREPKPLPISGKSGLARTRTLPAETLLGRPDKPPQAPWAAAARVCFATALIAGAGG